MNEPEPEIQEAAAAAPDTAEGAAPSRKRKRRRGRRGRSRHRRRGRGGARVRADQAKTPADVARVWFGVNRLHPEQVEAIDSVLLGRDTLVVLPTGYGKSLIYQVPAMLIDRPTVVISPLIALMRDQEHSMRRLGVPAVRLDSTLRAEARRQTLARIKRGGRLIILTTPETLESKDGRPAIMEGRPGLLCVDEAHCVSEWGHDFRPAYLRIGTERQGLDIPTTLCLTATATPRVRGDIAERLRLTDPTEVVGPPDRDNLELRVEIAPGNLKIDAMAKLLKRLRRPGIIYCATTKAVDEIYGALRRARFPCTRYHGKMGRDERNNAQKMFMKAGRRGVMVATTAFGMGIDKADIRYILHYQVTGSLEQYVQEAGRAGRDGKPSQCILLFDPADVDIQKYLQRRSRANSAQLDRVADAIAAWVEDNKPVAAKDLALSASVPGTTCRAVCVQLEELGLIVLDEKRRYVGRVSPDELRAAANDLVRRLEVKRREDTKRLRAIVDYAESEICRSVFIRNWFGITDPTRCGRCDNCMIKL